MLIKKIYLFFHLFTCLFIPVILGKIISDLGIYLQIGMITTFRKIIFFLKCFIFVLLFFIYYTYFQYYKHLKFYYLVQIQKRITLGTVMGDNDDQIVDDNHSLNNPINNNSDINNNLESDVK